jgi:hypothetical protein
MVDYFHSLMSRLESACHSAGESTNMPSVPRAQYGTASLAIGGVVRLRMQMEHLLVPLSGRQRQGIGTRFMQEVLPIMYVYRMQ